MWNLSELLKEMHRRNIFNIFFTCVLKPELSFAFKYARFKRYDISLTILSFNRMKRNNGNKDSNLLAAMKRR